MGTEAQVVVVGGTPADVEAAQARVEDLERRWSRFRPDSELQRLNAGAGGPVRVSADTRVLVEAAIDAWRDTGGRFAPTVLDASRRRATTVRSPPGSTRPGPPDRPVR